MKNRFALHNEPKDLIRQNSDVKLENDNNRNREMREMKSLNKHFEQKKKHFFFEEGEKIVGDYRFDPKKEIGNGYSSKVYKAISIKDNQEYAIKALELTNFKPSQFEMLENEIRILKKVSHPNVIKFYNVSKTKTHLYIVTEFCSKGDLLTYMTRKGIFAEKEALEIFVDILKGMQYLFKLGIIHRDIKPGNILFDGKNWKIADFGFSLESKDEIRTRNNVGTPLYMPIESLEKNLYSSESDIFSVGVLFFELLVGITPWECRDEDELMRKLKSIEFKIPSKFNISNQTKELLRRLCQPFKENRMNKKEFCLLNPEELKREVVESMPAKKNIFQNSYQELPSSLTPRDLPKTAFNLESSIENVSSLVKLGTETNFFTTGKMKKSSENIKNEAKQLVSKIKSTTNLTPKFVSENLNAEENQAGQSTLIKEDSQKANKGIMLSLLNFCRFMFYLMKNAQFLELNEHNRHKIKFVLIKHSIFILRQLLDTQRNWFGLQGYESYRETKSYNKFYLSFQDYMIKYEKEYQHLLKKVDEEGVREVNQKIIEFNRDEIHYTGESFYKRLINFIAPILRENNHNLGLEIIQKKKSSEEMKEKIEAIKSFLKYYRLLEILSQEGGLSELKIYDLEVIKSYQETKATVEEFMHLRKEMKYI